MTLIKLIEIMKNIKNIDFHGVDLNLIIVFSVLFEERSVTKAAERLHLGQPAVSASLKRLRILFDDPLFVRTAQGMHPTPEATVLATRFAPLISELHSVLFSRQTFDPTTDEITLRIGMSDWIEHWLMPDLLAEILRDAPAISLNAVACNPWQVVSELEQENIDLAVTAGDQCSPALNREQLAKCGFTTVWDSHQIPAKIPLTRETFIRYPHLMVSYRGASQSAMDKMLQEQGTPRQVRYISTHFSVLPLILSKIPAFATIPALLVDDWQKQYGFDSSPVPAEMPDFALAILWHRNRDNDPAVQWLLVRIRRLMKEKLSRAEPPL